MCVSKNTAIAAGWTVMQVLHYIGGGITMKRFLSIFMAVTMLLSVSAALAEQGTAPGGIDPVGNNVDYTRYDEMKGYFEDGDFEAAWEVAQEIYTANSSYEDIYLYYQYLRALVVLIPEGEFAEAYHIFNLLAGRNFEKSKGYSCFAMGLKYYAEGDAENKNTWMVTAFNEGINEAKDYIDIIPPDEVTIELSLKDSSETSLSVSWTDSNGSGPYRVTCIPVGMSTPIQDKTVNAKKADFRDLLPDTSYSIKVAKANAPSNADTETYATKEAWTVDGAIAHSVRIEVYQLDRSEVKKNGVSNTINTKKGKYIVLSTEGYTRGNRKPSDSRDDFYLRVNFAGNEKYSESVQTKFTYVLRSNTDPMVSVGKTETVTLERGRLAHSFFSECLTDLMDQLYENDGFSGDSFIVEVYMNNQYIGEQEFAIKQR